MKLLSCGCAVLFVLAAACSDNLPSEKQLREDFDKHRATLEQLVRMSNEDFQSQQVTRVAPSFVWRSDNWLWPRPESEWGLSPERWQQYKTLFAQLKLPAGLDRAGPAAGAILLAVHGAGVAGGGAEYGYLWAERRPMSVEAKGQSFMTKPLKDKWYLYRWRIDKAELSKNESRRFLDAPSK